MTEVDRRLAAIDDFSAMIDDPESAARIWTGPEVWINS